MAQSMKGTTGVLYLYFQFTSLNSLNKRNYYNNTKYKMTV